MIVSKYYPNPLENDEALKVVSIFTTTDKEVLKELFSK
jgi:hypothetical protein